MSDPLPTADRLLEAQVAWVVAELTGDRLRVNLRREVDALLVRSDTVLLGDLLSPATVMVLVDRIVIGALGGPAAVVAGRRLADVLRGEVVGSRRLSEVVDRGDVAALVDALAPLRPVLAELLDRLTDSPAVGALATSFVTQVVVDVLEANRSIARRIPGVGSIVSLGTNAATRVVGATDRQVRALLGDTAGRGAALVVRRLNAIVLGTLDDPLVRVAALEVWDAHADDRVDGLTGRVAGEDLRRIVEVVRRLVAAGAPTAAVRTAVEEWVRAVHEMYGDRPVAELLAELAITREDLVTTLDAVVPPLVEAAIDDGWLAREVRERLAPFYSSDEVAAIIEDH